LELGTRLPELPEHSREAVEQELTTLDFLQTQIESAEQRLEAIMKVSVEANVEDITLVEDPQHGTYAGNRQSGSVSNRCALASYAGLVLRVHSSGGHTRMGQVCGNVNRNLKWAFMEIGNLIAINQRRLAGTHAVRLYQRINRAKNHQKAVVAVARHLAEGLGGCSLSWRLLECPPVSPLKMNPFLVSGRSTSRHLRSREVLRLVSRPS
jgi:transposase